MLIKIAIIVFLAVVVPAYLAFWWARILPGFRVFGRYLNTRKSKSLKP